MESESRVGGIVREEGQVDGPVAKVKSERIALRASREQNVAVAFAQVTKRHCRWAVIGNAADAPLEVAACHRSGVKVGGSVVEEIGLAGTRVPQGGEEGGEAHPEARLPIGDAVSYADGLGVSNLEDGGGLLIGEGLAARGDEGLWALDPGVLAQQASDESGDRRGRAHDDAIVPVDSTDGV